MESTDRLLHQHSAEPNSISGLTLFGMAALILALGVAFYFEKKAQGE
jgi:hypothetical protein